MTTENLLEELAVDDSPTAVTELLASDFEQVGARVSASPTRFIDEIPLITPWSAPVLSLELELEHLIGAGVLDVAPPNAEITAAHDLKRKLRRLPKALRRRVELLRTTWHRAHLADLIELELQVRVEPSTFRDIAIPGELLMHSYVPEIHRRVALRALAADASFLRDLDDEASKVKADGHLVRLFGGTPRALPKLTSCEVPQEGVWKAESWVGLAMSSMPEAIPEEVVVALAQRTLSRYPRRTVRRKGLSQRILHWGAMHSTFSVALTAVAPGRSDIETYEVDTLGQAQSVPCVKWRSNALPRDVRFDLALVHLPPPGEQANNIRARYKDLADPAGSELHLADIGRLGPRKWRIRLFKVLREILGRVQLSGEVALVLPTSVRTVTRLGKHSEWGYAPRPELIDGISEFLRELGWRVTRDIEIIEQNPQAQPFFVHRRCTWRLMLVAHNDSPVAPTRGSNVEDVFL